MGDDVPSTSAKKRKFEKDAITVPQQLVSIISSKYNAGINQDASSSAENTDDASQEKRNVDYKLKGDISETIAVIQNRSIQELHTYLQIISIRLGY